MKRNLHTVRSRRTRGAAYPVSAPSSPLHRILDLLLTGSIAVSVIVVLTFIMTIG